MANEQASPDARKTRISEIRMIALSEMSAKTGDLDHWSLYGELQELLQRPFSPEWLEAVIAVATIGRIRPAKLIGFLAKLRSRREKDGKPELFVEFEATLQTYLGDERLTNHGFGGKTFADIDHGKIWAKVDGHLKALREEGYEVFLNSGTLLGVVRDAQLIAHDDDVDLAVILRATNADDAAEEWTALRTRLEDLGLFDSKNYKQPAIYKLKPADSTQIDLFPAWVQDGKVYVYPHTHGALDESDVLPLQPCKLTGNALPAAPEKMLALNYGEGWKKPDPLFKFPWGAANNRFAPFLERLAT